MIKNIFLVIIFFISHTLTAQNSLGFSNYKQELEIDSKTLDIEIDVTINQPTALEYCYIRVFNDSDSYVDALYGISSTNGYLARISINESESNIISLPINLQKNNSSDYIIRLRIEIVDNIEALELDEKMQTVFIREPINLSFESNEGKIDIDMGSDKPIEIPFTIISSSFPVKKEDSIKCIASIIGLSELFNDFNTSVDFNFNGNNFENKILIEHKKSDTLSKNEIRKKIIKLKQELIKKEELSIHFKLDSGFEKKIGSRHLKVNENLNTKRIFIKRKIPSSTFTGNRYNFYLGTNFDFGKEIETNSFYSEIDVFIPDLSDSKTKGKLGMRAGIYKNSSVSSELNNIEEETIKEIVADDTNNEVLVYDTKRVITTPQTNISNLGLYFQGLRTMKETNRPDFKFRLLLGFHIEVIERTETTEFNNEDLFSLGTTSIPTAELLNDENLIQDLTRGRKTSRKFYDSYYGLTMPILFQNNYIEVFMSPVLGFGNPGNKERLFNGGTSDTVKMFGVAQFYLMERKFGIKLSGEVRKYFASGQTPIISVNVSKSINLSGILSTKNNGN
ncbi:hypothetical protein [Pontimicrobium sp. MEBiC01747]